MVRLAECATFQEGYVNPSQRDPSYFGDDVKWLRATDLNNGFVFETGRRLSKKGFESAGKSATLFAPGTLAISKSGTIGRIGILQDYMCGNRAVINIKPNATCDTSFLFYTLLHSRAEIETLAEGSVQKNLYVSTLGNLKIALPSLVEQKAIGSQLGALDDRITLLRETNATLEAIAQALFKSWFVDFDPVRAKMEGRAPEGMDEATAALFPDTLEESELGWVPKGWGQGTLPDIAKPVKKQLSPANFHDGINYVGLEHIPRRSLSLTDWDTADGLESAKAAFAAGDILFGKLRPYFHKVVVAPFDGVCSTDVLVFQPTRLEYRGVAMMHLFSADLIGYAERLSNGAKMPRVSWSDLAAYPIVVPPISVSQAYTESVAPLIARMTHNVHAAQTLSTLRDTLLPRLISGQLRLPDAQALLKETA
ncbi:restriction endonuclease subunit S [Acidovorax sp. SUPP3334]|uniref:restriction endonuclease subunit S n=1 Tax=Acidovorax sp. SUPP3334 TaxID=2920881 RepID=UPI0023DE6875|nr:restriction endonuclease subunit S [Acidovorax sp. SUPP3334]GKT23585.1 restriction endonuclease subunit S [Acidovorax sp. SUPP3334]